MYMELGICARTLIDLMLMLTLTLIEMMMMMMIMMTTSPVRARNSRCSLMVGNANNNDIEAD